MPEKVPTYRIDESALRRKLLDHKVEPDAAKCEAIEQEVSNLRFKKSISLPKVNLKVVLPVVLVAGLATAIYFNLDRLKDLFSSAPEVKPMQEQTSVPVNKPEEKITPPTQTVVATPTLQVQPTATPVPTPTVSGTPEQAHVEVKAETSVVANNKKSDSSTQDNSKKPNPVLAQPPSDSAAKKSEVTKRDSSVQKTDQPVRKKKKRRRRNANVEELKQSTLQQSGNDDDVVVPQ